MFQIEKRVIFNRKQRLDSGMARNIATDTNQIQTAV
jgi:hypothetical protein